MQPSNKLSALSRSDAIELATRMRNKARNVKIQGKQMMTRLVYDAVSAGVAYGVGYWMGGLRYEKSKLTEQQIEAEGDPTQWGGVDKDLVIGLVATGIGIAMQNASRTKRLGEGVEAGGLGALAGWAYSRGDEAGFDAEAKA